MKLVYYVLSCKVLAVLQTCQKMYKSMPTRAKMAKHWKWQSENTHKVHPDTEVILFNASAVLEFKKKGTL
jgi:hypothetical protein